MYLVDRLSACDPLSWALFALSASLLALLVPYFLDFHTIREYPGPLLARLSNVWLCWTAAQGHRSESVHELHKKYGQSSSYAPSGSKRS